MSGTDGHPGERAQDAPADPEAREGPDLFSTEILALADIGLSHGILLPDEVEALCRAVLRFEERAGR